jgi:hypothetical protein
MGLSGAAIGRRRRGPSLPLGLMDASRREGPSGSFIFPSFLGRFSLKEAINFSDRTAGRSLARSRGPDFQGGRVLCWPLTLAPSPARRFQTPTHHPMSKAPGWKSGRDRRNEGTMTPGPRRIIRRNCLPLSGLSGKGDSVGPRAFIGPGPDAGSIKPPKLRVRADF